jgi:hypothetical protein
MSLRRSKSRDGRGKPYISAPQPINPRVDGTGIINKSATVPSPIKKSSSSLLKRTASWTTDRKKERERVDKSSPLARSETVSVTSSPKSMEDMAAAIPTANGMSLAGTTGQRQVDVAKFGEPHFNPDSCKD